MKENNKKTRISDADKADALVYPNAMDPEVKYAVDAELNEKLSASRSNMQLETKWDLQFLQLKLQIEEYKNKGSQSRPKGFQKIVLECLNIKGKTWLEFTSQFDLETGTEALFELKQIDKNLLQLANSLAIFTNKIMPIDFWLSLYKESQFPILKEKVKVI
ncbi:MAG: hypothetical protein ABIV51_02670 [Saprospiraceae bacterium]